MPHWLQILTSVLKTRLELVWQMDFTCCWKTQPCPTPLHTAHTSPVPILQSPASGAGNRATPRHHLFLPASMLGPNGYICWEEQCAWWVVGKKCLVSPIISVSHYWAAGLTWVYLCAPPPRPHLYQLEISHWELAVVGRDPGHFPVTSILLLLQKLRKQLKFWCVPGRIPNKSADSWYL